MDDNYLDEVRRLCARAARLDREGHEDLSRRVLDRIAELAREEHRRRLRDLG